MIEPSQTVILWALRCGFIVIEGYRATWKTHLFLPSFLWRKFLLIKGFFNIEFMKEFNSYLSYLNTL
jgi:hypothetical protein